MKRMIKILIVALLMVVILAASISPAVALRRPGGVLLPTTKPCDAPANSQGVHMTLNPPGRTEGCWVLLPPNAP
jgi:hypothetical protein